MPEQIHHNPNILLTEKAIHAAQAAGAVALETDPGQLQELVDHINTRVSREAFPNLSGLAFVAAHPSKAPWKSEKHLYQQPSTAPLFHPRSLSESQPVAAGTLGSTIGSGLDIVEFRVWKWQGNNPTRAIARRLLGPPPQEAKMIAGYQAWSREAKSLSTAEAQRIEDETVERFPGAVVVRTGRIGRVG